MRLVCCLTAFLLWSGFTSKAMAQSASCLPPWNSLQMILTLDTTKDGAFTRTLEIENGSGRHATKVVLDGEYSSQSHQLLLKTHFDDQFNGVSLPYNLYSALITESGEVAGYFDFTRSCTGPGVGFFPGQAFTLPAMKIKSNGKATIQVMIWGMIN